MPGGQISGKDAGDEAPVSKDVTASAVEEKPRDVPTSSEPHSRAEGTVAAPDDAERGADAQGPLGEFENAHALATFNWCVRKTELEDFLGYSTQLLGVATGLVRRTGDLVDACASLQALCVKWKVVQHFTMSEPGSAETADGASRSRNPSPAPGDALGKTVDTGGAPSGASGGSAKSAWNFIVSLASAFNSDEESPPSIPLSAGDKKQALHWWQPPH